MGKSNRFSNDNNDPLAVLHPSRTIPKWKRIGLIVVATLQTMCISDVVFGWATLEGEGTFMTSSVDRGGAGLSVQQAATMFAMAASVTFLSTLPMGWVLDICGPRVSSMTTHALMLLGCQLFAVYSPNSDPPDSTTTTTTIATPTQLTIGLCLMAVGVNIAHAVVHLANLFPNHYNLIVAGMNGSITFSFAIFTIMEWIWEAHQGDSNDQARQGSSILTMQDLFGYYRYVIALSLLASFLLWPDEPYPQLQGPPSSSAGHTKLSTSSSANLASTSSSQLLLLLQETEEKEESDSLSSSSSLWSQATSGTYRRIFVLFVTTTFCANWTVASFPVELSHQRLLYPHTTLPLHLEESFTIIYAMGMIPGIIMGHATDLFGLVPCTVVTLLTGSIHQILTLILMVGSRNDQSEDMDAVESLEGTVAWLKVVAMLSFAAYACFRNWLFRIFFSSVSMRLGFSYFGTLVGIAFATAGTAQLGIAPLIEYMDASRNATSWLVIHAGQILLFTLLLVVPYLDATMDTTTTTSTKKTISTRESTATSPKFKLNDQSNVSSYGSLEGGSVTLLRNQL